MGTGTNGKWILIWAQAAVTKLKAITHIASVARFRLTGILSINTSVETRVIMLLENSFLLHKSFALFNTLRIIS
jgi:hypothetical protein